MNLQTILESPIPMLVLMGLVFYFLLFRPQQQRAKAHREMIEALKRGDVVVTQGGLVGKVVKVEETEAVIELSKGVDVRLIKHTIADVRNRTEPKPANDAANT
ncbi:preprotein translocase subunit YajC [Maricaulis sp.]|uniref:preprotein translocase subunit YajC n=1 Tax=Maricaulis sp. TaxID=1486257 RepID=UPI003A8FC333|tara:strand:- start:2160 stop:2468 length:309 start_codon:yes stop_codon:yes gene_type:complete